MITKQIALCNASLLLIGASRIQSFDDGSTEGVVAEQFYERSFQALLSQYPWNFASKTQQLGQLPDAPEYEYKYKFQLPSDYVWIQRIFPNGDYKILGDKLHSNYSDIGIKYTWRVNEEMMPVHFEQAFVYYLASQMCISLTEDTTKQATLYEQYMDEARKARSLDAQMAPQDGWDDFPIDTARY